jgi:hypothetical protein
MRPLLLCGSIILVAGGDFTFGEDLVVTWVWPKKAEHKRVFLVFLFYDWGTCLQGYQSSELKVNIR